MRGWVRLWRKLQEHPFWRERRKFSRAEAWIDLLLRAAFEDHVVTQGNGMLTVKRGQVLTSQVELARTWIWSRETVRAFLLRLESLQMAAIETSKATDTGYTLITLLNYERYQGGTDEEDGIESAIGSAIQLGIDPPSTRHPSATPKKEKKGKKVKNPTCPASADAASGRGQDGWQGRETTPPPSEPKTHRESKASAGGAAAGGCRRAASPAGANGHAPGSPVHRLVQVYTEEFAAKVGTPPVVGGADYGIIAGLLKQPGRSADEVERMLRGFYRTGTRWARENAAFGLRAFLASYNKLLMLDQQGDL